MPELKNTAMCCILIQHRIGKKCIPVLSGQKNSRHGKFHREKKRICFFNIEDPRKEKGIVNKIRKGGWVQIEWTLLEPRERPEHLPAETRKVPLRMRAKGILQEDASPGETASVLSTCGRILSGTLVAENPPFTHSFGPQIPEFIGLGDSLRSLWGNKDE